MEPTPISKKLKEVFKHSILYGLTSSLQSVLGFILLPILTSYYETEVFGVYSIILLISAVANALFYLGGSSALGRFYYEVDTETYRKQIITTTLSITLAGALLLILLGLLGGPILSYWIFETREYAKAITLALTATAMGFLLNLMTLILRYNKKSVLFMAVTISGVIVNFLVTYILLVSYDFGLMAPIYGLFVANLASFLVLMVSHLKMVTFNLKKDHFKLALNFGFQSLLAGFLFYVLDWIDRMIIKDLLDLSEVGIYSLGYKLGSVVHILLIIPFSLIWAPIRMQYWKDSNAEDMTKKVFSYFILTGMFLVFSAILFVEEIVLIFFNNQEYAGAFQLIPLIMFSLILYGCQNILDFGIYIKKKLYFYSLVYLFGIGLNVGLNYWLIPIHGYMAAAFVTIITYLFIISAIYVISNRMYKMPLEWIRVCSAVVIVVISYYFVHIFGMQNFIFKITFFCAAMILLYFGWLRNNEREAINKMLTALTKKQIKT